MVVKRRMNNFDLIRVEIDYFRGYSQKRIFELESGSDLSILAGANGLGKTSFFDAVEWAFSGRLFRYEEANEEKNNSHFINHRCGVKNEVKKPAEVRLTIANDQEKYFITRKSINFKNKKSDYGSYRSQLLLVDQNDKKYFNQKAEKKLDSILIKKEWQGELKFKEIFSYYHLLTQDKLNAFVRNAKGPERWQQISNLLGTRRFLSLSEEYKKKAEKIKEKLKPLEKKCENLKAKSNNFSNLYSDKNISQANNNFDLLYYKHNLEKWKDEFELKLNLDNFNFDNRDEKIEYLLTAAEEIKFGLKAAFDKSEEKISAIKNLRNDYNSYQKYKREFKILKRSKSLFEELRNLNYLKEHLEEYYDYHSLLKKIDQKKKKIQKEKVEILEAKEKLIPKKEKLKNLYELLTNMEKDEHKNYSRFSKLSSILMTLKIIYPNSSKEYNYYFKQIGRIKPKVDELEEKLKNCANTANKLQNQLYEINHFNDELFIILEKSLNFLEEEKTSENGKVKCPVCSKSYPKIDLITEIRAKIRTGSKKVKQLKKEIVKRNNEERLLNKELKKEYQQLTDLMTDFASDLKKDLDILLARENDFKDQLETLREKEKTFNRKLEGLNYINHQIKTIIEQYDQLKLSSDTVIETFLDKRIERLKRNKAKYKITFKVDNYQGLEKRIILLNKKINKFEEKLKKYNLSRKVNHKILKNKEIDYQNLKEKQKSAHQKSEMMLKSLKAKQKELRENEIRIRHYKIKEELKAAKAKKEIYLQKLIKTEKIVEAVKDVVSEMNEKILSEQQEFINRIFKRIYPHPYFRDLILKISANSRGNNSLMISCLDSDVNKEINPAYTFSAAQINIVALSIFLSMALKQKFSRLNTILLDDPVQSMDDLNIVSFVDVLRSCCLDNEGLNKQLIVSTHDDKFYRLLRKKFRFLSAAGHYFTAYDQNGPEIIIQT